MNGAPLEDARHLTHRYDRMRQEFEIQVLVSSCFHFVDNLVVQHESFKLLFRQLK